MRHRDEIYTIPATDYHEVLDSGELTITICAAPHLHEVTIIGANYTDLPEGFDLQTSVRHISDADHHGIMTNLPALTLS